MSCSGCLKQLKIKNLPSEAMYIHILLTSEITWPNLTSEELEIDRILRCYERETLKTEKLWHYHHIQGH